MNPFFHIRSAKLEDISALFNIEKCCFDSDYISKRQFNYLISKAKAICLVVESETKIVGYAIVFIPKHQRPARLYSMAVLPEWRKLGIAKQLLLQIINEVKHRHYVSLRLEVKVNNTAALHCYEQIGFKAIQALPGYYGDGTNGIRLNLSLSQMLT